MSDPVDELLSEFADLTAAARPSRPDLQPHRRPAVVSAIGALLVLVVVGAVALVIFGTRTVQPPVAAVSPKPSATTTDGPTVAPNASPSSAASAASVACNAMLGNPPFLQANSTEPSVVASFEVTGEQFANYLPSLAATDGGVGEFDWQQTGPNDVLDICFFDGDLITPDPGPPHDISAVRVLVAISKGQAQLVAFARHDPSVLPIVDASTITLTPTTVPTSQPAPSIGSVRSWAPDSQHLIAYGRVNTGDVVLDATGAVTGTLPVDFINVDWFDSSTIVASGTSDGNNDQQLFDVTGHKIGSIPGPFGSVVTAPGIGTLAAVDAQGKGDRYKIWDGSSFSDWHDGRPLTWSADGSRLAVLHFNGAPGNGYDGNLSIVDRHGVETATVAGWTTNMLDSIALSVDGRYLATCLASGSTAGLKVFDTQSQSIGNVADSCSYGLVWSNEPKLFVWDAISPPITWTPGIGAGDSGLPSDTDFSAGANGELATWRSDQSSPSVQVLIGGLAQNYTFPGPVYGAAVSPDGRSLAVNWVVQPGSDGSGFAIVSLAAAEPQPTLPPSDPSPPPSPMVSVPDALGSFWGWAPDGTHFIAKTSGGFGIFDLNGVQVAPIPETEGTWVTSRSVVTFGNGALDLYDLSGTKSGEITGDFEGADVASGGTVLAAIHSATGDNAIGTTYQVWNGYSLSKIRDGVPLAWAPDASKLAVLVPFVGPGHGPPGEEGHVAIVDTSGATQFTLNDWDADWLGPYEFSPDGSYLAACFQNGGDRPTTHVVDVLTRTVSPTIGICGYTSWTADDTFYSSSPSDGTHLWTPIGGVSDPVFPPQTLAISSTDGRIASWSGTDANTLKVTTTTTSTDYPLAGYIENVFWSPDGTRLVVVSGSTSPSGFEMTVITP